MFSHTIDSLIGIRSYLFYTLVEVILLHDGITKYFHFYNQVRQYQALDYQTPESVYYTA